MFKLATSFFEDTSKIISYSSFRIILTNDKYGYDSNEAAVNSTVEPEEPEG
jgi:hypothetical protein